MFSEMKATRSKVAGRLRFLEAFARPRRTAMLAATLVMVFALPGLAGANGSTQPPLPSNLEELVPTLSQDLQISPDQARARLWAGVEWDSFGGKAMSVLGDRYAGAQLVYGADGYPSQFQVYVAGLESGDQTLIPTSASVPVKLIPVAHSISVLEQAAQAIASVVGGTGRIAIDFASSGLIVRPEPSVYAALNQSQISDLVSRAAALGVTLTFEPEHFDVVPTTCNTTVCDPPIRAGTYLQSGSFVCTSGFVAAKGGGAQNDPVWIMTAGHCIAAAGSGATWDMKNSSGSLYAIGSGSTFADPSPAGSGPDWGLIFLNSTYTQRANAANWVIAPGNSQHQITGWLAPFAGESLCFTGTTTGIVCGTTTRENSSNRSSSRQQPQRSSSGPIATTSSGWRLSARKTCPLYPGPLARLTAARAAQQPVIPSGAVGAWICLYSHARPPNAKNGAVLKAAKQLRISKVTIVLRALSLLPPRQRKPCTTIGGGLFDVLVLVNKQGAIFPAIITPALGQVRSSCGVVSTPNGYLELGSSDRLNRLLFQVAGVSFPS